MSTNFNFVGRCLCFENFLYVKDSPGNGVYYYKCRKFRKGCKGRVIEENGAISVTGQNHNHEPDTIDVIEKSVSVELNSRTLSNPRQSVKRTYDQVISESRLALSAKYDTSTLAQALPPFSAKKVTMQRQKWKSRPTLPKCREDITLGGEWSTFHDESFILENDGNDDKIIVFGTQGFFTRMCATKELFMDGTFYAVPKLFSQVYTIHGMNNGKMTAFVYTLLPKKDVNTYRRLLRLLQDLAQENHLSFNPEIIQIDFELSMKLAVEQVLPNCHIRGCLFHFRQAIWRKIRALKLENLFKEDTAARKFFQRFLGLPFVKLDDIDDLYLEIVSDAPTEHPGVEEFLDYMVSTWIQDDGKEALFPRSMWNHHGHFGLRTNNHLEGWHAGLKKSVGPHPNIFEFVNAIKEQQEKFENQVLIPDGPGVDDDGIPISSNAKYRRLNTKIKRLTSLYRSGQKTPLEFLDEVKHALNLDIGQPAPIKKDN